jgi:hypothetical protein
MFDCSRPDMIILHMAAERAGPWARGKARWLTFEGKDLRFVSCGCTVPILDWKGRRRMISARGVSYTTHSEAREAPKEVSLAFPKVARNALKVHQEEGLVDMIIREDNPQWLPYPVCNTPNNQFTQMWTNLCSCYILRENRRTSEDA